MTRRRIAAALTLACVVSASGAVANSRPAGPPTAERATLAFVDVNVVPMDSERVLPHQNVVIRGDRIVAVGPADQTPVPRDAQRIDATGKWLMPGLADLHVHLNEPDDGTLYVANGVTTIRNMWGFPETLAWRREYASGKRLGPTVYTTGPILDGKPPIWPSSTVIETAEQAEREIAAEEKAGYEFVKVYSRLTRPAYVAILEAAKRHHLRVVGHVPEAVGVHEVLRLRGQESIEHLTGYMTAAQRDDSRATGLTDWNARRKAQVAGLDPDKIPALARETREAGVWNCVTLIVGQRFAALDRRDSMLALPESRYEPAEVLAMWDLTKDPRFRNARPEDFDAMREVSRFQLRMTRALRDAGAKILLGTDTSNPFVVAGFSAHTELALLVDAGLTPYEALRAGTSDAAEFLHATGECGRVSPGLRADLLLLDANPLDDIHAVDQRRGVVLRGRWLPAQELDTDLAKLAAERAAPAATNGH
jgi:imidazolonepropionase-like amidohydrolase